jgi:hypothetical protein
MAKKSRSLLSRSVLEPKLVLPSLLEQPPAAPPPALQHRYQPPPSFAVHDRRNAARVMSFASRRRNH